MNNTCDATSIHEAGHGVMAILVGLSVRYITNVADSTTLGRMYWAHEERAPFTVAESIASSPDRARALVNVGGVAAVRAFLDPADGLRGPDKERAWAFARATSTDDVDAVVATLVADAQGVFTNEHVRNVTIAIAHRLRRDRIVLGVDMETLIDGVGLQRRAAARLRVVDDFQDLTSRDASRGTILLGSAAFVDARSDRYIFRPASTE